MGLNTCRDVHTVPVNAVVLLPDVADMDADSQGEPHAWRRSHIVVPNGGMDLQCRLHRVEGAVIYDKQAVADGVYDLTPSLGDKGENQLVVLLEHLNGALFVFFHKPRVSNDIGEHNRGQSCLLHSGCSHNR